MNLLTTFFGLKISPDRRKTICVDFDGVIHRYTSPWAGPKVIKDPPVDGAIIWLTRMIEYFDICIYSSRNKMFGGRKAMKAYLRVWGLDEKVLKRIRFPIFKPAAYLYIDDRAFCFKGNFPDLSFIENFKPWNRNHGCL